MNNWENCIDKLFVAEASTQAVIHAACTTTVPHELWFTNFKSNLSESSTKV